MPFHDLSPYVHTGRTVFLIVGGQYVFHILYGDLLSGTIIHGISSDTGV